MAVSASGIGYAAAVALAAIFAIAAASKLRDLPGTAERFDALGLPSPSVFAAIVPLAEIGIVLLLLIVPAAGGLAALVTLAFFTTFLVGRLRAGVHAPCACFGAARALPLSWVDVARNLGLAVLAAAALLTDRPGGVSLADLVIVLVAVTTALAAGRIARRPVTSPR